MLPQSERFAPSLSKGSASGRQGFDKLSPNGDVPGPNRLSPHPFAPSLSKRRSKGHHGPNDLMYLA